MPDTSPVFGQVGSQVWTENRPVEVSLGLEDGNFGPTCTLTSESPALPSGVTLEPTAPCILSGTPTAVQGAEDYTFTATDYDGDTATLVVSIEVEPDTTPTFGAVESPLVWTEGRTSVDLSLGVTGGNADVTCSVTPESPALPAGVTLDPTPPCGLSGLPTTAQPATDYTFAATDRDGDEASLVVSIEVEGDSAPGFEDESIAPLILSQDKPMSPVTLPSAVAGNGELAYAIVESLPSGLAFEATTRALSGTPTAVQPETPYTYTVADRDGDEDWLLLTIEVEPDTTPTFGAVESPVVWTEGRTSVDLSLGVTGGNADVTCSVAPESPALPAGVTLDPTPPCGLSGLPTTAQPATDYTFAATDRDSDEASLVVSIEVEGDSAPGFEVTMIDPLFLSLNKPMSPVTLPSAVAGNGELTYAIVESLPSGLEFEAATRVLSGTPTAVQPATEYAYTVGDRDGDEDSLPLLIAVEEDSAPEFGVQTIVPQFLTLNEPMVPVTLPAAVGGNGELTYEVVESLPSGLEFDGLTRVLSGTPTEVQPETGYTYMSTDRDGDAAELPFSLEVAAFVVDDASFVSWSGVPGKMVAGTTSLVTVRMKNEGTTTWTPSGEYRLGSQDPQDNVRWGRNRAPLPGEVAPGATVDFTFGITAPAVVGSYGFEWQMVRDGVSWFGLSTGRVTIAVEDPSFGDATIVDQTWVKDVPIEPVVLPAARGTGGALGYSLTPALPTGVSFSESTRTVSGTPSATMPKTEYTYTATDGAGNSASLTFHITVEAVSRDGASFVSWSGVPSKVAAGSTFAVTVTMENAGTTTWSETGSYRLGSQNVQDNLTWGVNRVSLPADPKAPGRSVSVPPNTTVDFTLAMTAPSTTGSRAFEWQMVRDGVAWFGSSTGSVTIEVEDPSFGDWTIPDQTLVKDVPLEPVVLPSASGTGGALSYSLTPALPTGVSFSESTRTVSGTPTELQDAVEYTYTATDGVGSSASLTFTIEVVASLEDDASFVSWSGVPGKMVAGTTSLVTVRMKNEGTTTWTPSGEYRLGSQDPQDNVRWGRNRAPLPGEVAPGATVDFTFGITAPAVVGSYGFEWQMVRDGVSWFGLSTGRVTIAVEDPSFGDATIVDQTWVKDVPIEPVVLPAARGTGGALSYSLVPVLPPGVSFTESTRTVSGTPSATMPKTEYTYTATDGKGNSASLTFHITVEAVSRDGASFVSWSGVPSKVAAGSTFAVTVTMENAGTTTWSETGSYRLGSQNVQDNLTWGVNRVSLPADPKAPGRSVSVPPNTTVDFTLAMTAPSTTGSRAFEWQMVRDGVAWFGSSTGSVTIEVEDPSFGDATIVDQTWVKDVPIEPVVLPAASGTGGALSYSLVPALPAGVSFTESTRTVSGTPTATMPETEYTYTATDGAGNSASLAFHIRVASVSADDALFVSTSGVPSKMAAGTTASVTVRMENVGTTTWRSSDRYSLGSQGNQDNLTWGLNRVPLPGEVAPNTTAEFTFTITAPSAAGSYGFVWQMVRDGVAWFGSSTPSGGAIEVEVIPVDDASFVSTSGVPSKMAVGSTATVTVTMENVGTTTWAEAGLYRLGSESVRDNTTWGTNRAHLPGSVDAPVIVPPKGTVEFRFEITAPSTVGPHAFEWRMVRDGVAWFGSSTGSVMIEVEDPSFGDQTIIDQTYVKDVPIEPVVLPAASGSGGALSYAVTPPLPAGLTFTESTRTLSGTPTVVQAATAYTYTATDGAGNSTSLTFSIRVAAFPVDDASFVSWSGVPGKMVAGSTASVTVTMKNVGTTTWTEAKLYRLGSQDSQDNVTWGTNRAHLPVSADGPVSVVPNATVDFTFTITAPSTVGARAFAWRMVHDGVAWFGEPTGSVTIEVEDPSFGDQTIADATYVQDEAIEAVVLPAASGRGGALSYSLSPALPAGLSFSASTRTISGTPTDAMATTAYVYTATDAGGDSASLTFSMTVEAVLVDDASFVSTSGVPSKMAAGSTASVTVTMKNVGTTTWTEAEGYRLGSENPQDNVTWGLNRVELPASADDADVSASVGPGETVDFTLEITAPSTVGPHAFEWKMVHDGVAWFGESDGKRDDRGGGPVVRGRDDRGADMGEGRGGWVRRLAGGDRYGRRVELRGDAWPSGGREFLRVDADVVRYADGGSGGDGVHVHGVGRERELGDAYVHDRGVRGGRRFGRRVVACRRSGSRAGGAIRFVRALDDVGRPVRHVRVLAVASRERFGGAEPPGRRSVVACRGLPRASVLLAR